MKPILPAILAVGLVALPAPAAAEAGDFSCPCRQLYPIQKARLAFMGTLTDIRTTTEECPGFECRVMDITFKIEEPWKGVPVSGEVTFRTDDTSCGYGFQLAPPGEKSKLGETFAVFAESGGIGICDSVIMHKSLLYRSNAFTVYFEADD